MIGDLGKSAFCIVGKGGKSLSGLDLEGRESRIGNNRQDQFFQENLLVKGSKEGSSSWQEIQDLFKLGFSQKQTMKQGFR